MAAHRLIRRALAGATAMAVALTAMPLAAQQQPLSTRDSFRIGSAGVQCSAQNNPADKRLSGMFDRGYTLTCRDAAGAIGTAVVVRRDIDLAGEATALGSAEGATCSIEGDVAIPGVGNAASALCRVAGARVEYRRYAVDRGATGYFVEGLAGYDPALRLALATLVNDAPQTGEISVAATAVSDAAAFARVQAGVLDAEGARTEAYNRNNGGRFAEAAEFFETLASRGDSVAGREAELLANQALQQSNLGNFAAAEALLARASGAVARNDGVTQRLVRNYRAINFLNQRRSGSALTALEADVEAVSAGADDLRQGVITDQLAEQINRENQALQRLGGIDAGLTAAERAQVLDGQAEALAGVARRQQGNLDAARTLLESASRRLAAVRDGRIVSTSWLRSEVLMEAALVAEAQGRTGEAQSAFDEAVRVFEQGYPGSPVLLAAKARRAGFQARTGNEEAAMTAFGELIAESEAVPDSSGALRELLLPYFVLLARRGDTEAAAAMFSAAQVLQRPGVAQTQAILARELSEGNDEAAALFRLAVSRTRDVARTEAQIARLAAVTQPSPDDLAALELARSSLATLKDEQTALQAQLSDFPRYKVLAGRSATLADMQAGLGAGEAYYKLAIVGDAAFAMLVTPQGARAFQLEQGRGALDRMVASLRDSIVRLEDGQPVTYPFDVALARQLYLGMFAPVEAEMSAIRHLVVEPDGPLLQLPPYLLVTEQAGADAYAARVKRGGDEFDFTGIAWLGRDREVSISVGPRAFLDVRTLAPSSGSQAYLGLGGNALPPARPIAAAGDACSWPASTWEDPIDTAELELARSILGADRSALLTGPAFTDTALLGGAALDDYRILHFATHGLVTAPRPSCPARPALVTSFGGGDSDGLLTFREIFDMKLDADIVILSACDTAGMATVTASREAGVTTGGNFALDGLVRAFVGAGARSVLASHWPVPDDYDATKRLIGGLFGAGQGTPLARSLADAQRALMDDALTSHPYYWAAFVIVGDGRKPLIR